MWVQQGSGTRKLLEKRRLYNNQPEGERIPYHTEGELKTKERDTNVPQKNLDPSQADYFSHRALELLW